MTDNQLAFRELSVRFLREVRAIHGVDKAKDIAHLLKEHLGSSWSGQVTQDVLADTFPTAVKFEMYHVPDGNRIEAVKCIRALTGAGLYEAKQAMEAVVYNTKQVILTTEERTGDTPESMAQRAKEFEQATASKGILVRRYYGA